MSLSNELKLKPKHFTQSLRKICIEEKNNVTSDCIPYQNKHYKKLFPFCFETLHFDLIANDDFFLALLIENEIEYIAICFSMKPRRKQSNREDRLRLLSMVFNDVQNHSIDQLQLSDEISNERNYYITYKLYEMLREQHSSNPTPPRMPNDEEYKFLKPVLREYQKSAVGWLLTRENTQDKISGIYYQVSCRDIPENIFYLNNITLDLYTSKPAEISVPSGGILADEMGLGKTVEMLALILSNTRNLPTVDILSEVNIPEKRIKQDEDIFCVCPSKWKRKLINCIKCNVVQHSACVRKYSTDSDHICPDCWEKMGIYESGATIIVSPEPIKMQWHSEIMKHSNKPLKILLYTGIKKMRWISPAELAQYDIVLTDYGVLRSEIYFAQEKSTRSLRGKKTYMQVTTPLVMVRWWRVCLDEAQIVETTTKNSSQMVKHLPAIHRWAVTGTPIEKSIEDLTGLLDFLDLEPFNDNKVFSNLVYLFQRGCSKPLLNILSKVMWRTCKVAVLDQLGIPPQTEEVRYVTLSDAERLHYQSQHQLCFAHFEERVRKLVSSSSTSKIEPRTLQMLLEPLRKLRQDCTVPVLLQKSDGSVVKTLLQPSELLQHLKVTNEIDCKSNLRTIASSYNGIGALHFIRGEFLEATKCYEAVLRRAKEYTGTISVDSLLQIHALDNLLKAHEADIAANDANIDNVEQLQVYRNQCDQLEWKYIETNRNNLTKAQESYNATLNSINEIYGKFSTQKKRGLWWRIILCSIEINNYCDQLFARINDEKRSSYSSSLFMDFHSREAIDYALTIWSDNLFESRKNVIQAFDKFKPFINNVKPKEELNEETQTLLKSFVKNTFDCHLKEILNDKINDEESLLNEESSTDNVLCKLCEAKKALADLECKLFNKQLDVRTDKVRGVENPSLQETILKIICSFARAKNIGLQDVKDGESFLQLIEYMKKEYKEFGKVWIETEYTVKAYDELDMCKLRLQAIDPENMRQDKNKLIYNISKEEIDLMFDEFKFNLKTAELEFVRKLARLKYLKHLEKQSDPEICPICTTLPESRYCMLECGHHMCLSCLAELAKYGAYIKCSVCRNRQKYQDVYYVTHKVNEVDGITITGFYSSKIEEIVRNVLKLKEQDENVKILIFSQWEGILTVISNALIENGVKIKQRKSTKNVDEFKDPKLGITCLLLLLSHGSKGLNLVEATHVFLVEPILNPGEELQAIGRVHRIGQTKPTMVHRFISKDTIEETIFDTVYVDQSKKWELNNVTIDNIRVLLSANNTCQPTLDMTFD